MSETPPVPPDDRSESPDDAEDAAAAQKSATDMAGFGTGARGLPRPPGIRAQISDMLEQLYLKHGYLGAVVREAARWPKLVQLAGGKPLPLGTVRRYLDAIFRRWEEESLVQRPKMLEKYKRSIQRRMAKAEDAEAWGAVSNMQRLMTELDGLGGRHEVRIQHEGSIAVDVTKLSDVELVAKVATIMQAQTAVLGDAATPDDEPNSDSEAAREGDGDDREQKK